MNTSQIVLIITVFFAFFPLLSAQAYLDPGVGNMLVQLLAAGVAGFLTFLTIFWKKQKKKDKSEQETYEKNV